MEKSERKQNILELVYSIARSKERRSMCPQISFKDFKKKSLKTLKNGTIVKNVPPAKLFISQRWFTIDRAIKTFNNSRRSPGENTLLPGYISSVPIKGKEEKQCVIILGDGHHHALYTWDNGENLDIFIVGEKPQGNYKGLSTLRRDYGAPFRGLT